jgi:hypothetical protein
VPALHFHPLTRKAKNRRIATLVEWPEVHRFIDSR